MAAFRCFCHGGHCLSSFGEGLIGKGRKGKEMIKARHDSHVMQSTLLVGFPIASPKEFHRLCK